METKTIKSPEGVTELMRELWIRHKVGILQRKHNIFVVELPPPSTEEIRAAKEDDK